MTYRQEDDPVVSAMVIVAVVLLFVAYVFIFVEMGKLVGTP